MARGKRTKFSTPTLDIQIGPEQWERAQQSKSGGCLVADAIKQQYPHLTGITVDMATIRATDRAAGERATWLTPPSAQHLLLSYDQGWPQALDRVVAKRPVKYTPVTRARTGRDSIAGTAERREARKAELEAKVAAGEELTVGEKRALTTARNPKPATERPVSAGPAEVRIENSSAVVHGGRPLPMGKAHPNLLRGSDRHFGAKLASPGEVFDQAVEAAVAERLAAERQS